MRFLFCLVPLLLVCSGFSQNSVPHFRDIAASAGLVNTQHSSVEKRYILESMSGGVALFDCDNDGKLDLYVTGFGGNVLYRGLGGCKFEDVTERSGVAVGGFSTGAAWGDYDRDGLVDLFVG